MKRLALIMILVVLTIAMVGAGLGLREARKLPIVRQRSIALPRWPAHMPPMRVVFLSDIHLGSAASTRQRLDRIVGQINALHPDLILIAGDFVDGENGMEARSFEHDLIASLTRLRARLGTVATLGNHDVLTGTAEMTHALRQAHITVLENDVVVRGPLTIVGVGDAITQHASLMTAWPKLPTVPGPILVLTHASLIEPQIPAEGSLLLAGHSHCGQIALPGLSSILTIAGASSDCGYRRDGARTTIVSAGIGTSRIPFRIGAPPDIWLLTLGP